MANHFPVFGNDNYTRVRENNTYVVACPEVVRNRLTAHHISLKVVETSGCSWSQLDSFSFVDVVGKPGTQPVSGFFSFGA